MADKYIKVASLKNKLNYIFRNYGTTKFIRDKVNEAIKSVPCYFKGELDTTLEVADVQEVKHGKWKFHERTKLVPTNKVGIKEESRHCFSSGQRSAQASIPNWSICSLYRTVAIATIELPQILSRRA